MPTTDPLTNANDPAGVSDRSNNTPAAGWGDRSGRGGCAIALRPQCAVAEAALTGRRRYTTEAGRIDVAPVRVMAHDGAVLLAGVVRDSSCIQKRDRLGRRTDGQVAGLA